MIYQLIIRGMAIEKVIERMLSSVISNGNVKMNCTIVPYLYVLVILVSWLMLHGNQQKALLILLPLTNDHLFR